MDARRGCSHRCQVVEPRISHPCPCVSTKCLDVLRHFAMGSRPLTLPPLGSLEVAQIRPEGPTYPLPGLTSPGAGCVSIVKPRRGDTTCVSALQACFSVAFTSGGFASGRGYVGPSALIKKCATSKLPSGGYDQPLKSAKSHFLPANDRLDFISPQLRKQLQCLALHRIQFDARANGLNQCEGFFMG